MNHGHTRKEVSGYALVFGYLGIFMILVGVITAIPLILILFYPEEVIGWKCFAYPAAADILAGFLLYFALICGRPRANFQRNEDSHLLIWVWLVAVVSGAATFWLAHIFGGMDMSFTEAFFESASAYSTTGLTQFKDYVDARLVYDAATGTIVKSAGSYCPHLFCYMRAQTQFVGGVGLVLLLSMVLGNSGGMSLYVGEGHGDRLVPNLRKSAAKIFGIYIFYTIIGSIALWLAGMEPYDAITTSMSALSAGGFSCRSSNILYYRQEITPGVGNGLWLANSLAIELIVEFLVILSGVSFVLHTFLLSGKWKEFWKDDEVRFFLTVLALSLVIGYFSAASALSRAGKTAHFFSLYYQATDSYSSVVPQEVLFYVIGAETTSGFSTVDLTQLGEPLIYLCTVLMVIGGGVGSCGGGIKQYRVAVILKDFLWRFRYRFSPSRLLHPKNTYRYGERKELDNETIHEAFTYSLLFLILLIISVIVLAFFPEQNHEITAFNVASAMSNTGLSLTDFVSYGKLYPGYYQAMLWILSADMLLGRLEILPLLYAGKNVGLELSHLAKQAKAKHNRARLTEER